MRINHARIKGQWQRLEVSRRDIGPVDDSHFIKLSLGLRQLK